MATVAYFLVEDVDVIDDDTDSITLVASYVSGGMVASDSDTALYSTSPIRLRVPHTEAIAVGATVTLTTG